MKTSGIFSTHAYTIPVKYNKPFKLIFFGDVHRDAPAHAHDKWQDFLAYARKQKDAWFIGMGDYLDSTSTSERECLGNIALKMHETFNNDQEKLQTAKCTLIARELDFMKGRLIGMINGNHFYDFKSKINSDQMICHMLNTTYLGVCAFVRLTFAYQGRSHCRDLYLHHGMGAARLTGNSLNRVGQMAEYAEADIYAMGHDHSKGAMPGQPRMFLTSQTGALKLEFREPIVIRSGSFLKSYEAGSANYNVDACRGPKALGHVEVLVNVKCRAPIIGKKQVKEVEIEMRTVV